MHALPWLAGGLNPNKAAAIGKFFILDLEEPNPQIREAALLAAQALGLKEKDQQPGAGRFHTLWVEHPDPETRALHLGAILAYLDHTPVQEERMKWFSYLSQATSRECAAAYEHARHARFADAADALKRAAGHDRRFQVAAGLDKAKSDVARLKANHKAQADAKAEQTYLQAQARLTSVLNTAGECGEAAAARKLLLEEWHNLPKHLRDKHPKPVA